MIQPENVSISDFTTALKSGKQYARITYILKNVVFENADIVSDGIMISTYINDGDVYKSGYAFSKQVVIHLFKSSKMDDLNMRNEFILEFGTEINNVVQWAKIGYFKSDDIAYDDVSKIYTITAYDRMQMFDVEAKDFLDTIPWDNLPVGFGVDDVLDMLCKYVNIDYTVPVGYTFYGHVTLQNKALFYQLRTCRDILCKIIETTVGFAKINNSGVLEIFRVGSSPYFPDNLYSVTITKSNCYDLQLTPYEKSSVKTKWGDLQTFQWKDLIRTQYNELNDPYVSYYYGGIHILFDDGAEYYYRDPDDRSDRIYTIMNNPFMKYFPMDSIDTIVQFYYTIVIQCFVMMYAINSSMSDVCALFEPGDCMEFNDGNSTLYIPIYSSVIKWDGVFTCQMTSPDGLE